MTINFHPHALVRMAQRGATQIQVIETVEAGEHFEAKFGRVGFRRNFIFEKQWQNRYYKNIQVIVYAVMENTDWLVISVITRYF
jgi:hypothetical protein